MDSKKKSDTEKSRFNKGSRKKKLKWKRIRGKTRKVATVRVIVKLFGVANFSFCGHFIQLSIEGKNILLLESDKENVDIKPPEKRTSNFRMNVETPFDPNFWPARGRRGRGDFEKFDDCLAPEDYFEFQCQQEMKAKISDSNFASPDLDSDISTENKCMGSDCYRNLAELKVEGVKKKLASDAKISHRLNQLMSNKRRRQKILPLSRLLAYGNGLYFDPGNYLGEKMKKQNVFWVVRGKKNFQ